MPTILSFQGRLTDSSGNLLGGSGTGYYFKFSIWDSPTVGSGNRLWPTSAPGSVTTTVRQGVFTVNVGDTANGFPDALTYAFDSETIYLQVEVSSNGSSYETLSPRQQIAASAFARVAGAVSGTGQSAIGTTTPLANTVLTVEATSSIATPLSIRGAPNQSGSLLTILSSVGSSLFSIGSSGSLTALAGALFGNASSTLFSTLDGLYVGRTATTTILGSATSTFGAGVSTTRLETTSASSTINGLRVTGNGLQIASLVNCAEALETDASGNIVCGTDATAAGAADPFTFATNYGITNAATSSPLWALAGINASSTSHFATFDAVAGTTTNFAISNIASSLLKTNATGGIVPAIAGTDYLTSSSIFSYLFPSNATSTALSFTGGITTTNASTTNLSGNTLAIGGTATTTIANTGAITTPTLTIGTLTGFLKATAGVVAAAAVNVAADITGILPTANGGTGWGNVQANTVLLGNGTGALATTTAGANGQVLALVGGVPTWTATTTLSTISGTLGVGTGGTGQTTFAYGLLSSPGGTDALTTISTSSLGLLTTDITEGSNLYYTTTRFDNRLSATTSLPNITTLTNLSISATQLSNFGTPFYQFFSATTTDALTQGSTNKYYSDPLVQAFVHASSTIPKTYTANTFTGANTFSSALTLSGLNGPLDARNGVVGATTSVGVLYGGTGLTSAPSNGSILLGNSSGGYSISATSSLGIALADTTGTLAVARGGTGATTLSDLITLGTHTSGNYLATLTNAGGLTIANSGAETAAVTAALDLTNANTWTGKQNFYGTASSTLFSANRAYFGGTATTSISDAGVLTLAGLTSTLLKADNSNNLVAAVAGVDYSNFAYLFPGNATTTALTFSNGILSSASTTIGAGTQATGLTVSGGATTTGNLIVQGTGTSTFSGGLQATNVYATATSTMAGIISQSIVPNGDATYDLGSATNRFRDLYLSTASLHLESTAGETGSAKQWKFGIDTDNGQQTGTSTGFFRIQEGSSDMFYINHGGQIGVGVKDPRARLHTKGNPFLSGFSAGTISSSGTAVTGSGTGFLFGSNKINVGDQILSDGQIRTVTSVVNNTSLVVDSAFSPALSAHTYQFQQPIARFDTSAGDTRFIIGPGGNVGIGDLNPQGLFSVGAGDAFFINSLGTVASGTWNGQRIGALYGGTGSTTLSGILIGNGVNPVGTLTVGSGLSLTGTTLSTSGAGITSIGSSGQQQTGGTQAFATSTSVTNGLVSGITIVGNSNTHTFTPSLSGVLTVAGGGTGGTSFSYGLVSSPGGTSALTNIATSSLGLLTTDVAEGTNQYYTDTRVNTYINASTTIPKTYTANTFTNTNSFTSALMATGGFLSSASSTINGSLVVTGTATSTTLAVTGVTSSLLKTNSLGQVVAAVAGTDYTNFGYLFPANATTTALSFTGGITTTNASTTNLSGNTLAIGGTATTSISNTGVLTLPVALSASSGGTGISSVSAAQILLGNYAGTGWQQLATSSLGLLTTNVAEGSNQYFTNARVQTYLDSVTKGFFFATTSADYWETQQTARSADDLTNNSIEDLSSERVKSAVETYPEFYLVKSDWSLENIVAKIKEMLVV
ncbi:MAG: hypothetical protein AAB421_00660 [Patescibacteria group bacterium]